MSLACAYPCRALLPAPIQSSLRRRALRLHIPNLQHAGRTARRAGASAQLSTSHAADIELGLDEQRQESRLNPSPDSFAQTPFIDNCSLKVEAGSGGHGCISFLRDKYIADGPANGGDGGSGGNIFIQAVRGETSLHKLARRGQIKAGRGANGQGKAKGGERGDDVLITVPIGTVIREVQRYDPVEEEELQDLLDKGKGADARGNDGDQTGSQQHKWRRDKWLLYPGALPSSFTATSFPALPRPRRSNLTMSQPSAPIRLDLDKPMSSPMLLAAGAMGGLGNPHFATRDITRPKFATKGDNGMRLSLQLELKILADVGLVGLPNAGKSTLLRAISNSRARIGDWAFTTLQPNIGTVVLDDHRGRPPAYVENSTARSKLNVAGQHEVRTNFTVADIPGLIEDAHLDKGLGLGFLRHIERAAVMAFVIDLSTGNAVSTLKSLWREVGEYESMKDAQVNLDTEARVDAEGELVQWSPLDSRTTSISPMLEKGSDGYEDEQTVQEEILLPRSPSRPLPKVSLPPISTKPWFVVATKADLLNTQPNFSELREYLTAVEGGHLPHPSGRKNAWRKDIQCIPISAIRAEGVERIKEVVLGLLD
ncbi:MAG: GTPase of the mitochondrial inner membrane that associates with the large ribosomal subunit [Bathelium mastoideum]|nr:MAG: GTPase of the mitochondrial inner membrane that associates with the large ribosomal subunit [Bathelium mastoideum]